MSSAHEAAQFVFDMREGVFRAFGGGIEK